MIRRGLLLAGTTAVISGVSNFVGKIAVAKIPPLPFTTLKNIGAFFLLTALFLFITRTQKAKIRRPSRKDWYKLLAIGIIGGSIPFYLFFEGLSRIPAVNASLIHKSLVVWIAILAMPFLRERLTPWQIAGIALLFLSNLVIGGFKGFTFSTGEFMILAATLLWSIENIIAKKTLSSVHPVFVGMMRMGIGAVVLVAIMISKGAVPEVASYTAAQWTLIGITSVLLFGYVATWYSALALLPATSVAAILVAATVITNILSALFVTHTLSAPEAAQGILILVGIGLVVLMNRVRPSHSSGKRLVV